MAMSKEIPAEQEPKPKFIKTINGEPCITLVEHEYLMTVQRHKQILKSKLADEEQLEFDRMKTARDSLLITNARLNSRLAERTWVGLTDDERISLIVPHQSQLVVIKKVEAKLKEKNT
jgi:hypothetical protein